MRPSTKRKWKTRSFIIWWALSTSNRALYTIEAQFSFQNSLWQCDAPWTVADHEFMFVFIAQISEHLKLSGFHERSMAWLLVFGGWRLLYTLPTVRTTSSLFAATNCFLVSTLNVRRSEVTSTVVLHMILNISLMTVTWCALFSVLWLDSVDHSG